MIDATTFSQSPPKLRTSDFDQIRKMVYEFCGVDLTGKQVLVGTRLGKRVRDLGFDSFDKYCEHVRSEKSGAAFSMMIDTLTTNHTSFFREQQHFDFLKKSIVPSLPANSPIAIWSAACSSGEEPYTIAFSLVEALGASAFHRTTILATDISTRVLERAKLGLYPAARLDKLPPAVRRECLLKGTGQYADQCLVKREVKSLIEFRHFNLLDECSSFGPFHVIFCRNVMIYFDQQTQQTVVNSLASRLLPGGYLLIGHSESLNGIDHPLQYISPATYRKKGSSNDRELMRSTGFRKKAK
jgi:chemotaxis protein methyltransferase CheR